ncbi:hypothetical protein [Proteiniclasticum sp. QWL-01]|uniref:hypothetical protein n=1 Tax=Proteiniclasticum sp. QWL-01 TaxID=3036945 RepID=UPI0024105F95|nr:hypothetical protein [Proteiniclasticum sp. QWL-01]WFF72910.1 hypothetical protein P6M73_00080 [Proteiniclasticum sp. QWL-01]
MKNTSATKVSVFLNGTYLNPGRLSGQSFNYTIPSNVTRPGRNDLRIQVATPAASSIRPAPSP